MGGVGHTRVFHYASPDTTVEIGEEWSVAEYPHSRPIDRGEVIDQAHGTVVLRMTRPHAVLSSRGVLLPFLGPGRSAINRRRDTLSAVAAGQTAHPLLRQSIDDPAVISSRPPSDVTSWFRADVEKSKRDVVAYALGTRTRSLSRGRPPGKRRCGSAGAENGMAAETGTC
jgi:hypothetical protein